MMKDDSKILFTNFRQTIEDKLREIGREGFAERLNRYTEWYKNYLMKKGEKRKDALNKVNKEIDWYTKNVEEKYYPEKKSDEN